MLKYLMKAYVMSVANYQETPGGVVEEIKDKNSDGSTVDDLLTLALNGDNELDTTEYIKLKKQYETELKGIDEQVKIEKIEHIKNTSIDIIAKKIVSNFNTKTGKFEVDNGAIEFSEDGIFNFRNENTLFNNRTKNYFSSLGVTADDVFKKIEEQNPILTKSSYEVALAKLNKNNSEKEIETKIAQKQTKESSKLANGEDSLKSALEKDTKIAQEKIVKNGEKISFKSGKETYLPLSAYKEGYTHRLTLKEIADAVGDNSQKELIVFQEKNNLGADGVIGARTYKYIVDNLDKKEK